MQLEDTTVYILCVNKILFHGNIVQATISVNHGMSYINFITTIGTSDFVTNMMLNSTHYNDNLIQQRNVDQFNMSDMTRLNHYGGYIMETKRVSEFEEAILNRNHTCTDIDRNHFNVNLLNTVELKITDSQIQLRERSIFNLMMIPDLTHSSVVTRNLVCPIGTNIKKCMLVGLNPITRMFTPAQILWTSKSTLRGKNEMLIPVHTLKVPLIDDQNVYDISDPSYIPYLLEGNKWTKITLYERNFVSSTLFNMNDSSNSSEYERINWFKDGNLNEVLYTINSIFSINDIFLEHDDSLGFFLIADVKLTPMWFISELETETLISLKKYVLNTMSSQAYRYNKDKTGAFREVACTRETGTGIYYHTDLAQSAKKCDTCKMSRILYLDIDGRSYVSTLYHTLTPRRKHSKKGNKTFTQMMRVIKDNVTTICLTCLSNDILNFVSIDTLYQTLMREVDSSIKSVGCVCDIEQFLSNTEDEITDSEGNNARIDEISIT